MSTNLEDAENLVVYGISDSDKHLVVCGVDAFDVVHNVGYVCTACECPDNVHAGEKGLEGGGETKAVVSGGSSRHQFSGL